MGKVAGCHEVGCFRGILRRKPPRDRFRAALARHRFKVKGGVRVQPAEELDCQRRVGFQIAGQQGRRWRASLRRCRTGHETRGHGTEAIRYSWYCCRKCRFALAQNGGEGVVVWGGNGHLAAHDRHYPIDCVQF
jgi:hypothetical protein